MGFLDLIGNVVGAAINAAQNSGGSGNQEQQVTNAVRDATLQSFVPWAQPSQQPQQSGTPWQNIVNSVYNAANQAISQPTQQSTWQVPQIQGAFDSSFDNSSIENAFNNSSDKKDSAKKELEKADTPGTDNGKNKGFIDIAMESAMQNPLLSSAIMGPNAGLFNPEKALADESLAAGEIADNEKSDKDEKPKEETTNALSEKDQAKVQSEIDRIKDNGKASQDNWYGEGSGDESRAFTNAINSFFSRPSNSGNFDPEASSRQSSKDEIDRMVWSQLSPEERKAENIARVDRINKEFLTPEEVDQLRKEAEQSPVSDDATFYNPLTRNAEFTPDTNTSEKTDEKDEANTGGIGAEFSSDGSKKMTQREQYVAAMKDAALRDYYLNTYQNVADPTGQLYGDRLVGNYGYEVFKDIGNAQDYSGKHDLVRDAFGYNKDEQGNSRYGINGWQDLAAESIPGLREMDDEAAIQAIMDFMWAPENIINPNLYISDDAYKAAHSLGSDDSAFYMGEYFGNNYLNGPGVENFLGSIKDQEGNPLYPQLDNADLGAWFMAGNLIDRLNSGSGFSDSDFERLNRLLGEAGENQLFGFVEDNDGMNWNKTDWSSSGQNYTPQVLLSTLRDNVYGQGNPLNIYDRLGNENNPLISADLADDLMAAISQSTNRKVGRRTND